MHLERPAPCQILFGPLYHAPVLGAYLSDPRIKTFSTRQEVRITERHSQRPLQADFSYDPGQSMVELFKALPPDWKPDLLIWYNLSLMGIPAGIEDVPCPTLAVIHDWHLNLQACLDYISAFDYVLSDRAFVQMLRAQGFHHCDWWPCYAHDPSTHYLIPGLERDYDITFLGNLDYHYHRERNAWLAKLLSLGETYRLLFADRYYGFDYTRILNRSKIVFNRSIRGEMNMRAYEALACGALLFMESENLEVRDFLEDGVSCVLYTEENLEDRLRYYLEHADERQAIAANGVRAIQKFTPEHQFGQLLSKIPAIQQELQSRAKKRLFKGAPRAWQALARARQVYFSRTPDSAALASKQLNTALSSTEPLTSGEGFILQAAQAAFVLNSVWTPTSLWRPHGIPEHARSALETLGVVSQAFPGDVLHTYNYCSALTLCRQHRQALLGWQAVINALPHLVISLNQLSWRVLLPSGHKNHLTDFGHLWNQVLAKVLQQKAPVSQLNQLLLWQAWEQTGYCLLFLNQPLQAVQAFVMAVNIWPGNYFSYAPLLDLLVHLQRQSEILPLLRQAVAQMGLSEALLRDYLLTLYHQDPNSEEYRNAAKNYRLLMLCTQGGGSWAKVSLHGWLPLIMATLPALLNAQMKP